jgi:hypothetical protein
MILYYDMWSNVNMPRGIFKKKNIRLVGKKIGAYNLYLPTYLPTYLGKKGK